MKNPLYMEIEKWYYTRIDDMSEWVRGRCEKKWLWTFSFYHIHIIYDFFCLLAGWLRYYYKLCHALYAMIYEYESTYIHHSSQFHKWTNLHFKFHVCLLCSTALYTVCLMRYDDGDGDGGMYTTIYLLYFYFYFILLPYVCSSVGRLIVGRWLMVRQGMMTMMIWYKVQVHIFVHLRSLSHER